MLALMGMRLDDKFHASKQVMLACKLLQSQLGVLEGCREVCKGICVMRRKLAMISRRKLLKD